MGSIISKLNEKFLIAEDSSIRQESSSMLLDTTREESESSILDKVSGGDLLSSQITPPNVAKLRCDPRSPANFNRTPLKVPLDEI